MTYLSFEEIRGDLGVLTDLAVPERRVSLLEALHGTLRKLGSLRERFFSGRPRKAPKVLDMDDLNSDGHFELTVEFLEPTKAIAVRTPTPSEVPAPPSYARRVPVSTTYNAERYLPYRILWAKVIIRATYDYALWKDSPDMRLRKFAKDAERWLFESSDLEFSFENICAAFDFPVERIRQRTRGLTKQDVKKLEFRERQGRTDVLGEASGGNGK